MAPKTLKNNLQDLPKWAQSEIETLQMRLREAKAELTSINDNPESNTILGWGSIVDNRPIRYLSNNQMITFRLKDGDITTKIKNNFLEISTSGISNGDMYIRPQVSNVIQIHLKN